jgi:hypothetical protein
MAKNPGNPNDPETRERAARVQAHSSTPDPSERPGVVPTSGPTVYVEGGSVGQNPYTDPPPMAQRKFYEDPRPLDQATDAQVLQGRGAPPYDPAHEPRQRPWNPDRFPDQAAAPRPADTPSDGAGVLDYTLAMLIALPHDEQERILAEARKADTSGRPPEYTTQPAQPPQRPAASPQPLPSPPPYRPGEAHPGTPGGVGRMDKAHEGTVLSHTDEDEK